MSARARVPLPLPENYPKLFEIRKSKTCSLRPTPMLRTEIVGFNGGVEPLKLRYYQVQAVLHLLLMKRMILGDGTGLGKTISAIAFLCYLWEKNHASKAIVLAPKSAIRQWAEEIDRFSTGIQPYIVTGGFEARKKVYEAWSKHPMGAGQKKPVLILNYHVLAKDWNAGTVIPLRPDGQPDPKQPIVPGLLDSITRQEKNLIVVFDECTAFKNPVSKTWEVCHFLSMRSDRVYGLTATLLKNNLIEGFAIYKVIHPQIFHTKTSFLDEFCVVRMQDVAHNRKIPVVVGYKNLGEFRNRIDPYFLGRPKHAVSDELPKLITKEVICELSEAEDIKYREALSGILEYGDGTVKDFEEHKAVVALVYCQQVVDSLSLFKFTGGEILAESFFEPENTVKVGELGAKEQALVDLLTEGELEGDKVIVYTRFASLVPRLQQILSAEGIQSVAITGDIVDTEKNPRRRQAQQRFQDMESGVQVIFITDAGSEAINLQAAAALVFYDAPWSWGNYLQILGRPIRIGSPHPSVLAIHLVAERPRTKPNDRKTIDQYTLDVLRSKKDLIDKVLGESAVGALDFGSESFERELIRNMIRDQRGERP